MWNPKNKEYKNPKRGRYLKTKGCRRKSFGGWWMNDQTNREIDIVLEMA
jgi:hypothetical protein